MSKIKKNSVLAMIFAGTVMLGDCGSDTDASRLNTEATEQYKIGANLTDEEVTAYTYETLDKTMYAKQSANVRDLPLTDGNKLGSLSYGVSYCYRAVQRNRVVRIDFDSATGYCSDNYLTDTKPTSSSGSSGSSGNGRSSSKSSDSESSDSRSVWIRQRVLRLRIRGIRLRRLLFRELSMIRLMDGITLFLY